MTRRLVGGDFDRIFDGFRRTAFRLETLAHYAVPIERDSFRAYLAGEPFDLGWHQPWLATIQSATRVGKSVRRVRVMTNPPTPYQAFELTITPHNLRAGEDIRILSTGAAEQHALPHTDFWLFDESRVVTMQFDEAGVFRHADTSDDPDVAADCRRVRDLAWSLATPYREYVAMHPVPAVAAGPGGV